MTVVGAFGPWSFGSYAALAIPFGLGAGGDLLAMRAVAEALSAGS